jgi:hypothetical protein
MTATATTIADTFPERFRRFVEVESPVDVRRRIPSPEELSPTLAAGLDRFGGYGACAESFESFERHRGSYFAAMTTEPTGSAHRSVHGAELIAAPEEGSEPDRVLLIHSHIGPVRLFMQSVGDLTAGRERGAFLFVDAPPPIEEGGSQSRRVVVPVEGATWNVIPSNAPLGPLAAVEVLRTAPSVFTWEPDARQQPPGARGHDLTFLGYPRRVSHFPAMAVRRTRCRIVFGVAKVRRPLDQGMDITFREPWTADELATMEGPDLLELIFEEAERDILDNLDSWNNWTWIRDGGLL